jgi:hypothetical protein
MLSKIEFCQTPNDTNGDKKFFKLCQNWFKEVFLFFHLSIYEQDLYIF